MENEATPCLRATEVLGRTKEIDSTGHHVYVLSDKVFKRPLTVLHKIFGTTAKTLKFISIFPSKISLLHMSHSLRIFGNFWQFLTREGMKRASSRYLSSQ